MGRDDETALQQIKSALDELEKLGRCVCPDHPEVWDSYVNEVSAVIRKLHETTNKLLE
jgi:hypothetical protein